MKFAVYLHNISVKWRRGIDEIIPLSIGRQHVCYVSNDDETVGRMINKLLMIDWQDDCSWTKITSVGSYSEFIIA